MKLKIAGTVLVVWAFVATTLLLWGIIGTAPWEHGRLCQDALIRRRTPTGSFVFYQQAVEDVAKWCY